MNFVVYARILLKFRDCFDPKSSNKLLQERELSHKITIEGSPEKEVPTLIEEKDQSFNWKHSIELDFARVNIYKGHPVARKQASCDDPGKLIRLPHSMEELKKLAGKHF